MNHNHNHSHAIYLFKVNPVFLREKPTIPRILQYGFLTKTQPFRSRKTIWKLLEGNLEGNSILKIKKMFFRLDNNLAKSK